MISFRAGVSGYFPFLAIDQLVTELGHFFSWTTPNYMFLCIYSACAKVISTNSIVLEKMDSMDESTIENSKLSWREITVRSGKMEDYSNMTRSISLKKVNIIGTSSIIQGLKMMV